MSKNENNPNPMAVSKDELSETLSPESNDDLKQVDDQAEHKIANAMAFFSQVRRQILVNESDAAETDRESADARSDSTFIGLDEWTDDDQALKIPSELPQSIDRFEIEGILGQGGFARVFLARDPKLDRKVALKVLKPTAVISDESRQRFQREAHAAAILSHPNIVPVFESGCFGPIHFLVSEYCEGETLAGWFESKERQVAPESAARIVARLAEAVQHAHQRGVVHRDLKPGNILLQSQYEDVLESFRITDFGLARISESDSNTLTTDGAIVGTPAYMSPEQARGDREINHSSDIFSLGVILYELLTGKIPFRGENHISTLRMVEENAPAAPRSINADIPRDLEAICLRALEKKTSDRYAAAHELGEDLTRWLGGLPVVARPIRSHEKAWRWCKRNPSLAAALCFAFLSLAIGLSLTTWKWLEANENVDIARQETARANKLSKRTNDALQAFKFAFMSTDPNRAGGPDMSALDVLETAAEYLPRADFDDEGKLIFYDALFNSFQGIGQYHAAEEVGIEWLQVAENVHGKDSAEEQAVRLKLASLLTRLSRFREAHDLFSDVLQKQLETEPDSAVRYRSQFELGRTKFSMGDIVNSVEPMQIGLDGFAENVGKDNADAIEMAVHLGNAYLEIEEIDLADKLLRQAFEDSQRQLPPEHTLALFAKDALSRLHEHEGKIKLAREMQNEILETRVAKLGADHPLTLSSNLKFVRLLTEEGQLKTAKQIAEEIFVKSQEKLGEDHRTTLMAMIRKAAVATKLEEYDQATELLEESFERWSSNYPDERTTQRAIRSDLGTVYLSKGQKTRNNELLINALSNFEQNNFELADVLPHDHSDVLKNDMGRGNALFWLKKHEAASTVFANVLEKLKRKFPEGHPDILLAINQLAICYTQLDRVDDAIEMFEQVVSEQKALNLNDTPTAISSMVNLGMQLNVKKRYAEAQSVLSKTVELSDQIPAEKLLVYTAKTALAMSYRGSGETQRAIDILENVVQEIPDDPRVGGAVEILRKCYFEAKQTDDYLRIVAIDLPLAKKSAGSNILGYTGYIVKVAEEMVELRLNDQAIELYRECLEIRSEVDSNAWYTHNAKSVLGGALLAAGEPEDAKPLLEDGYQGLVNSPPNKSFPAANRTRLLRNSLKRLVDLAEAQEDSEAANQW